MKKIYFLFVCSLLLLFSDKGYSENSSLILIAHPQVPVEEIDLRELNDYYLKKKRFWPDKTPVRPLDWEEGQPARQLFLSRVLNKSESALAQYWMAQKFQTGDQAPMSLNSVSSICSFVSTVKGSLSYLLASSETVKTCADVKVIGKVE